MHDLEAALIQEIKTEGPMPFVRFMEKALYTPGLGYYSSGQQKFGEGGDFITAPELSPLFSRCVARQCQQVLSQLRDASILEFGAGSGAMALEVMLTLEAMNCLPQQYHIIELSAELQARQQSLFQEKAPHLMSRMQWLQSLPEKPLTGVVLANEVLDAMPVHKFRWEKQLQEAYVDYKDQQFQWSWGKASDALNEAFKQLSLQLELGYESEMNLYVPGWINSISQCLESGLVLLIDYGFPRREYYHPDRSMGTIMCHFQHKAHSDPLVSVGLQDITAHVDFTAVAEAAVESGFDVAAYTHQAAFLMSCGITEFLNEAVDEVERFNWMNQVKRLTLPSEMGELFKVMALTKNFDSDLLGFDLLCQLEKL